MTLVTQIIEMASDGKQPLADVLRKCLVLAFELKNEKLKTWVEKELNGFDQKDKDVIPDYRRVTLHSKGNFSGSFGGWVPQRPLPMGVLEKPHREMLTSVLVQPIAAYDVNRGEKSKGGTFIINWPPDLIAHYQEKFIEGYALSQAWQEVPSSTMLGLCEEVRNRVLRFALEIRDELGHVADEPSKVPPAKIDAAVVNYILGGMNVIGGTITDSMQIGHIVVQQGDFNGLKTALKTLDVSDQEIEQLKGAIDADAGESVGKSLGERTKTWLQNVGLKGGSAGLKAGATIAQELVKQWLIQYLGLK